MSVAAIVALGFLSGIVLAVCVFVLIRKVKAQRMIWKDEGDLLRLRLWEATR